MARGTLTARIIALLVACASARAQAQSPAIGNLENALSDVKTVRTRFVQEKRMALFKKPLVTRGSIQVETPDKLLWRVDSPIRYALLIDGKQARQWDGETGKTETIPLAGNPVFAAVTEQLKAWFGGKYASLANDYDITALTGDAPALAFTPKKGTPPEKMLKRVTVTFRADKRYIASIRISETGGDDTTLTFEDAELNLALPPETWKVP
jgi:outer membrane lipoprotein-sorting protein